MLSAEELRFIESQRVAHLATADASGRPHVVPVCFAYLDGRIYIAIDEKPKRSLRLKRLRNIEKNPYSISTWMRDEIIRLREQYQFFHWHLAFPDVFRVPTKGEVAENEQAGWSGGFDVVLGNPPWERIKIQEKEWFASRRPDIANAANAAQRRRMIANLVHEDPAIYAAFMEDQRQATGDTGKSF